MFMVELDHVSFTGMGVDGHLTLQQEFPLSGVLGDRRRAAEAEAAAFRADADRVGQDVELEALKAYYMVGERRGLVPILDEQIILVEQLAVVARAHLVSGQGMQADVLRLDNERARLDAERQALKSEIRGAEAMLDAAVGGAPDDVVPTLAWADDLSDPQALDVLLAEGLSRRPELAAARAARSRALAEVDVMRSMYAPMALVRAGPSVMIGEGSGITAVVGVSIPLWRSKLEAGVTGAQDMVSMAGADIDAMQRMIAGAVASAREAVLAERTRLLALRNDILPRSRLVVESSVGAFAAGQGPMVAVLDAARDLQEVRMQELTTRARLGTAWAKLQREVGEL
jgi:outer membrane protein TolC